MQGVNVGQGIHVQYENHQYYQVEQDKQEIVRTDVHHLPKPTTALIGRKDELTQLTEAFTNPNKRLAIIVAAGGIGKSALTDEWLQEIAAHNYHGKTRVFGWSFYSQGSHNTFTNSVTVHSPLGARASRPLNGGQDGRVPWKRQGGGERLPNSQPFFSAVFKFFNKYRAKNNQIEIPKDEIEKARVLAECLLQQPCLLILDGLEPLQYSQNLLAMNGELQDSSLKEFIACFRRTAGKSFVLLSSRQPLVELKKWHPAHYLSLSLNTFIDEEGAELLLSFKKDDLETPEIDGTVKECEEVSRNFGGHALSLVLLAKLIIYYHKDVKGNIRYAQELPPLTSAHGDSDAEKDSRHALRVLDYYDRLLDKNSRCFMQLLGLLDRPMNAAEKAVLIANANHAEALRALTDLDWKKLEQRLENSGLLLGKKGKFERLEWDTHPIIRNFFGQKFKENHIEMFKQAHLVLFEYFQKLPEKEFGKYLPDTLEEMQPLYRAVVHGCLAGEHKQAISDIYYKRISRGKYYYSQSYLGAYNQDLSVLQMAIYELKKLQTSAFPETAISNILATISSCLMSLGRLDDAIKYTKCIIKRYSKFNDQATFHCITISYQNLVDIYSVLGNLYLAKKASIKTIEFSKLSKNLDHEIIGNNYLATTYYLSGKLEESEIIFKNAINTSFSTQRQDVPESVIITDVTHGH